MASFRYHGIGRAASVAGTDPLPRAIEGNPNEALIDWRESRAGNAKASLQEALGRPRGRLRLEDRSACCRETKERVAPRAEKDGV